VPEGVTEGLWELETVRLVLSEALSEALEVTEPVWRGQLEGLGDEAGEALTLSEGVVDTVGLCVGEEVSDCVVEDVREGVPVGLREPLRQAVALREALCEVLMLGHCVTLRVTEPQAECDCETEAEGVCVTEPVLHPEGETEALEDRVAEELRLTV
jgi:hypothetical protein